MKNPYFSFFKPPITNVKPYRKVNLKQVFDLITQEFLQQQTLELRSITNKAENSKVKRTNFPYVTFSGTFDYRHRNGLKEHSGLLCLDFDNVVDVDKLRTLLLNIEVFPTELLFTSPNGNGIKWVISINDHLNKFEHEDLASRIFTFLNETHGIVPDRSCKDLPRATLLCHDPKAFLHPKYFNL